jgi:hypothetical protein
MSDKIPETQCSMVAHARATETLTIMLSAILADIKNGKWQKEIAAIRDRYRETFQREREAGKGEAEATKKAKESVREMKVALPAVMFSGIFSRRAKDAIEQHSGVLVIDLDDIPAPRFAELHASVKSDPHTLFNFLSPTGGGLKVGVRIPSDPELHLASFLTVERYYQEHFGLSVDKACKDASRLCFVSDDADLFTNPAAVPFEPDLSLLEPKREDSSPQPGKERPPPKQSQGGQREPKVQENAHGRASRNAQKRALVETALAAIDPASLTYDEWRSILMALHNHGQACECEEWAYKVADAFSARDKPRYKAGELEAKWKSFKTERQGKKITLGTLFKIAADHGWENFQSDTIPFCVDLLEKKIPPILCVGDHWHALNQGVWRPVDQNIYRPRALETLVFPKQTNRHAQEILKTLEARKQVAKEHLRSFAMFDETGAGCLTLKRLGRLNPSILNSTRRKFVRVV